MRAGRWLVLVWFGALAVCPLADAASVRAVGPIGMTVSDLDRSLAFYTEVLDFTSEDVVEVEGPAYARLVGVFGARARIATLRLGEERIRLTEFLAPRGRPRPLEMKSNDRTFQHVAIVVSDMERTYRRLREHGVEHVSSGPQRLPDWNPNAGGIEAFYFRDPDGHVLEVIAYPPDKGAKRWQSKERLFLGIDHTAIVVDDTDASLAFYRDVLGLRIAGTSENWGLEQEHLNAVFGARLRITALRAEAGPGIEFLEYLSPSDGRPMPVDERANDLMHWQTQLRTEALDELAGAIRETRTRFVSPGVIERPAGELGFERGTRLRDPDGHVIELVEE